MKSPYYLVIGIVIGLILGVVVYPLLTSPSEHDEQNTESQSVEQTNVSGDSDMYGQRAEQTQALNFQPDTMMRQTRGISIGHADTLFQKYHLSRVQNNSRGIVMVKVDSVDKRLIHFFLDKNLVIDPLTAKVNSAIDSTLVGFAGLMAYDDDRKSHTMMWVAVVEARGENYYFLPENYSPGEKSYVYDYVAVCPEICPKNEDRIWEKNWVKKTNF